jgi:hypothetical protein
VDSGVGLESMRLGLKLGLSLTGSLVSESQVSSPGWMVRMSPVGRVVGGLSVRHELGMRAKSGAGGLGLNEVGMQ